MSVYNTPRQMGRQATIKTDTLPAPLGGINSNTALARMDPNDCIFSYNMVPANNGLDVREGFKEWVTAIAGTGGIRTLISVRSGNAAAGVLNRLYAATILGLYEVTNTGTAPALAIAFAVQTGNAGYGAYTHFTTTAGQFVIYWDELNGMYTLNVTTNTWTKTTMGAGAGQISNVDPALLVHGVSKNGTLFMAEKDSSRSWYLAPGTIFGAATLFELGNKFIHGGYLVGVYLYTVSGGTGPISHIVFLSSSGDVSVWQGYNPADATNWSNVGNFYVGQMPFGRGVANSNQFNGDLLIISVFGIIAVSDLIAGLDINDEKIQYTKKISQLINSYVYQTLNSRGWEIYSSPRKNLNIVNVPAIVGQPSIQFVQNTSTQGWGLWRDLPVQCGATYGGDFYFGTADGRVCLATGSVDNVKLDGTGAVLINFSMLSAYSNAGNVNQKVPSFIRAYFRAGTTPSYSCKMMFDFQTSEVLGPISSSTPLGGAIWDTDLWDAGIWGGAPDAVNGMQGASGIGVNMAIALRGSCSSPTTLIGFEPAWTEGAYM